MTIPNLNVLPFSALVGKLDLHCTDLCKCSDSDYQCENHEDEHMTVMSLMMMMMHALMVMNNSVIWETDTEYHENGREGIIVKAICMMINVPNLICIYILLEKILSITSVTLICYSQPMVNSGKLCCCYKDKLDPF